MEHHGDVHIGRIGVVHICKSCDGASSIHPGEHKRERMGGSGGIVSKFAIGMASSFVVVAGALASAA